MPKDCHETALNYLNHKERSTFEVESHLCAKGFQKEEIQEELEYLKELRYIDDARYCEGYFRYAIQKGRGPVRLQYELKEKGIDPELAQRVTENYFDRQTEKEAAMKEVQKLIRSSRNPSSVCGQESDEIMDEGQNPPEEKTIAKIGRRLASLGYHTEIIYEVIGQIRKP